MACALWATLAGLAGLLAGAATMLVALAIWGDALPEADDAAWKPRRRP